MHILANAHPIISVKLFNGGFAWEKRGETALFYYFVLLITLDLRLIVGGIGKAKEYL